MSRIRSLFAAGADGLYRRPGLAVLAVLALLAAAPPLLAGLRFDTSGASVSSAADPVSRLYRDNLKRFGNSTPLVIQLVPGAAPRPALDRFTDRLAETFAAWPDIVYVDARTVDPDRPGQAAALRAVLRNSGPEALRRLEARLDPEGMRRTLERTRDLIGLLPDSGPRRLLAADPLGLGAITAPFLLARVGRLQLAGASGYFDSPAGDSRLLFVQPGRPAEDADYCVDLLVRARAAAARLAAEVPGAGAIECRFSGAYALASETIRALEGDTARITLLAGGAVLLLMLLIFRSWRALLISLLPLAVSVLASFLFARLFFNPLNAVATSFGAIIIGLGIDVMLHCTGRFFQLLGETGSPESAVRLTLEDVGPPVTIGVTTTAAAFACLCFASYRGLAEFGLLTAGALLLTLVVSLALFPAAARLFAPARSPGRGLLARSGGRGGRGWALAVRFPRRALLFAAPLVVAALLLAGHFRFEMDLRRGLPTHLESLAVGEDISRRHGASFMLNTQCTLEAPGRAAALAAQRALDGRLAELVRRGTVAGFESPSFFLLYPDRARETAALASEVAGALAAGRERFRRLVDELEFADPEGLARYYQTLEAALAGRADDLAWPKEAGPGADPRWRRFIAEGEGRVYLQSYVWPANDERGFTVARETSEALAGFTPPPGAVFHLTGAFQVFDHLNRLVRDDFIRVSLISLAVVALAAFIFFRRLAAVLLCFLPLAAAIPSTFAALVLLGVSLPPTGIGVTAIVVGIGIDDAVHILSRVGRGGPVDRERLRAVVKEIGPIILLTSLSTMIGFGALMLSDFYSIFAMGLTIALGVGFCFLYTLALVPAALALSASPTPGSRA